MRQRSQLAAFVAAIILFALLSISCSADLTNSASPLDAAWHDAPTIKSTTSEDFNVISSDDFDGQDFLDPVNAHEMELHQVQATGANNPTQPSALRVNSVNVNVSQCSPSPVNIAGIAFYDVNNATLGALDVQINLTPLNAQSPINSGNFGLLTIQNQAGLTFNAGSTGINQNTAIVFRADNIEIANRALNSLIYTPAQGVQGTSGQILLEVEGTGATDSTAYAFSLSPISFNQTNYTPVTIIPIDAQSFSNLTASINQTVHIPAISVTNSVNSDDELVVDIQITNGQINFLSTTGLTFALSTNPQVINFVGQLADVNAALASVTFTAICPTGSSCGSTTVAGFTITVRDFANNSQSQCPLVAVLEFVMSVNPTGLTVIEAAVPAPLVAVIDAVSANVTWQSVESTGWAPSTYQPAPTAYRLSITTNSSSVPFTQVYQGLAYTAIINNLTAATTYTVKVEIINAAGVSSCPGLISGGRSICEPFTTSFTTSGVAPRAASVRVTSATSDSLTFAASPDSGDSVNALLATITSPDGNLGNLMIIPVAVAGGAVVEVITGLQPFTNYQIAVQARNNFGLGPVTIVNHITQLAGPRIVGFIASDPNNAGNSVSDGDQLTIYFSEPTNQPSLESATAINSMFSFSSPIGSAYSGLWLDSRTLRITLNTVGSANPAIGVLTVQIVGSLTNAAGSSDKSKSSGVLTGNWGLSGLSGYFIAPASPVSVEENGQTYLGVSLNFSQSALADQSNSYLLSVQILSPLLSGVSLNGSATYWSTGGIFVSSTGLASSVSNALNSLLLTPPRQYFGSVAVQFSLSQIRAGTTQLLGELVSIVTVDHINHPPVIVAPATQSLPLEQVVQLSGLSVSDVDVSVGSLTDFASLTLAVSKSGLLSFTGSSQSGVVYAPSFNGSHSSVQITGPLLLVNLALQNVQIQFEYEIAEFGAPAQYFLSSSLNDHGNGGSPILTTSQIVFFNLTCPADQSTIRPTSFTQAELSATGNELLLTLSLPVSESVLLNPFISCASIFNSVSSFGSGAVCHWRSTGQLAVNLGQGSTVTVNDYLNIQANAFQRCAGQSTNSQATSIKVTRASNNYLAPIAISGPATGSLCEDLTLTAVTFSSSSHSLVYSWTLPGPIRSSPHVTGLDLSGSSLTIPAAAFSDFSPLPPKFTFELTVTNFLGQFQSDSFDVIFNTEAKPFIQPLSKTTIFIHSTDALNIAARAEIPTCSAAAIAGAEDLSVVYSWTSEPEIAGLSLGSASSLSLPPATLEYSVNSQHSYTFTLQAALSSNENLFSVQSFIVVVKQSQLQARISGGRVRTVSNAQPFNLNAETSFDADATSSTQSSEYSFTWSCESSAPSGSSSGACYLINGELLALGNSPNIQIAAGELAPNSYTVSVVYTHIPTGRQSTTRQTIVVAESSSAVNSLSLDFPSMIINTGDKLSLSAIAKTSVNFDWSIIGSGSSSRQISSASFVNSSALESSLVLNEFQSKTFFDSGAYYGINVRATDEDGEIIRTSAAVYVNAAPVCVQSFAVSPSSGVAISTPFEFSIPSSSCFDSDADQDDQILYRFFRFDSTSGLYYWLSAATPESSITNVLLPPGSAVVIGVRVIDARGSFTEYTTSVSVGQPQLSTPAQYLAVYTNSIKMAAQTQDSVTVAARVGSFVSTILSSSLSVNDLISLKDSALTDLLSQSASLSDDSVTSILALIVKDSSSTSVASARFTLQFVESLGNAAESREELAAVLAIFDGIFGVIKIGQGASNNSGGRRRLLATSLDLATLNALNSQLFTAINSVSLDLSSELLDVVGDRIPLTGSAFSGFMKRGVVGGEEFSLAVSGSQVRVPSTNSALAPIGAAFDVSLIQTPAADFAYLALPGQVSDVYFLGAYQPATRISPLAPHLEPSTMIAALPESANSSVTFDIKFDSNLAGSCLNAVDSLTGSLCSLECRRWNGSGFDTAGVTTNFNALNNLTFTAQCIVGRTGAFSLFQAMKTGIVLSSTGSQASSSGSAVDQSAAVRASLAFPAPFVIPNMRDFKSGLVTDLSAMAGEPSSRFTIEQVTTNTASGQTTVIIDIWVPMPGSQEASAQNVYENLAALTVTEVLSTSYLRSADLSSWQQQCGDMIFRANCEAKSEGASAWMLPLIISAAAAGFLLLCALVVITARRYWTAPAKDEKSLDDGFVLPSAAPGQAKQYIYSPPTAGKEIDAEISRDEQVSDVTIVASEAGIDPHSQSGHEEEISEPVIVESEAEAAELAKNPELMAQVSRSSMEAIHEDEDSIHELSTNSASASGQSRHFYYVDESRREESQSQSLSAITESQSRSQSNSTISQTRPSAKSNSHFRIAGMGANNNNSNMAAEPSMSTRPSSVSTSQRSTGGAHFRYSDVDDSQSQSSSSLESNSPSRSSSLVDPVASFQTLSHLDLASSEVKPADKRAVRVVRPGQSS